MDFFNSLISLFSLLVSAGALYVSWFVTKRVSVISRIEDQIIQQSINQIEGVGKYEQYIIDSLRKGCSISSLNLVFSRMDNTYNRANLLLANSKDYQMTGKNLEAIRKQYTKCKFLAMEESVKLLSARYTEIQSFGVLTIDDSVLKGDMDRVTLVEFELRGLHTLWLQCCLASSNK